MHDEVRQTYFAYGVNLDRCSMERRCPGASLLGVVELPDFRFQIMRRGVATIVPEKGAKVYGALWRLTDRHLASLDLYEGVDLDFYRRARTEALWDGQRLRPWVYLATDERPGRPRKGYLEVILAAALDLRFPDDYRAELAAWL